MRKRSNAKASELMRCIDESRLAPIEEVLHRITCQLGIKYEQME